MHVLYHCIGVIIVHLLLHLCGTKGFQPVYKGCPNNCNIFIGCLQLDILKTLLNDVDQSNLRSTESNSAKDDEIHGLSAKRINITTVVDDSKRSFQYNSSITTIKIHFNLCGDQTSLHYGSVIDKVVLTRPWWVVRQFIYENQ